MDKATDANDILRTRGPTALAEALATTPDTRTLTKARTPKNAKKVEPRPAEEEEVGPRDAPPPTEFPSGPDRRQDHHDEQTDHGSSSSGADNKQETGQTPRRFQLTPLSEIKAQTADLYAVKGIFPRTGLAIIWGPPKCGKSFWTLDVLMHLAMGRNYRGHRVRQGHVIYCVLEGQKGFRNRIAASKQVNSQPANTPFLLMERPLQLVSDHQAFIADVKAQLPEGQKPAVVCIDTLNRSIEGSESDDKDMGNYLRAAEAIRDKFDCLVIVVHHCGHEGTRPRGHSSLGGGLDVQIGVKKTSEGVIVAELELSKDGETGLEIASQLRPVKIGEDDDGDPVMSCVIDATDAPKATTGRPPKAERAAFDALKAAIDACGETAPGSNHIPRNVRVVKVDTWRRYAHQSGISDSSTPAALKKAFERAHKKLVNDGNVKAWGDYRWIPQ